MTSEWAVGVGLSKTTRARLDMGASGRVTHIERIPSYSSNPRSVIFVLPIFLQFRDIPNKSIVREVSGPSATSMMSGCLRASCSTCISANRL